jgi:hypothetical protein
MSGYVYYIACTATHRVKIGYTSGPVERRLKALQTGAPAPLDLIAYHEGSPAMEQAAHKLFAEQRVCGEWFEMSPELFYQIIYTIISTAKALCREGKPLPEWVKSGLAGLADDDGEFPEYIKAIAR